MTTGERIRKFRKERGYSMDELASFVGTSKQTIHRYENGTITNIPAEKIEAIAAALGIIPSVLLGWDDGAGAQFPVFDTDKLVMTDNIVSVPISDMCVIAEDDSMNGDRILASDILLISRAARIENSDIVLVSVKEKKAVIRRVLFSNESLVLQASNPRFEPTLHNKSDIRIIGKVIAVISKNV